MCVYLYYLNRILCIFNFHCVFIKGTKANGTATDFPVQASAAIPNQPSPHTPAVTYDDTSQITLSRILHNTPYQVPMAYRKALGYS